MNKMKMAVRQVNSRTLIFAITSLVLIACCLIITLSDAEIQEFMYNSDQLTVPSFVEDVMRNQNFSVFSWMIPRAPYAFPDLPIYWILRIASGDVFLSVYLMAVWHLLFVCAAVYLFIKKVSDKQSARQNIFKLFLLVTLALIMVGVNSTGGSTLSNLFIPIAHGSAAACALISYVLFERYFNTPSIIPKILITVVSFLLIFSDKLFIVYFTIPYFLALLFIKQDILVAFKFCVSAGISACLAFLADKNLLQQPIDPLEFNPIQRISTLIEIFHAAPIPFLICSAIFISTAVMLLASLASYRPKIGLLDKHFQPIFFLGAMTLFSGGVGIMLWKSGNMLSYARYMVGFQLGGSLSVALVGNWLVNSMGRRSNVAVYTLCILALLTSLNKIDRLFKPLLDQRELSRQINQCKLAYRLDSGYANYWIARKFSMAVDYNIQVDQLEPTLPVPFFWGSNLLWYYFGLNSGVENAPNFIIEDGFSRSDIVVRYGEPSQEINCGGYHFLLFEDANKLQRNVLRLLDTKGLTEQNIFPSGFVPRRKLQGPFDLKMLGMQTGKIIGDYAVADQINDKPGYLLYGPYTRLAAGSYVLKIEFTCRGDGRENLFDVAGGGGNVSFGSVSLANQDCDGSDKAIEIAFNLDQSNHNMEFRTYYGGKGSLAVKSLVLRAE